MTNPKEINVYRNIGCRGIKDGFTSSMIILNVALILHTQDGIAKHFPISADFPAVKQ